MYKYNDKDVLRIYKGGTLLYERVTEIIEPMLVTPSDFNISISSASDLEIDWGDGTIQTVKSGDDTAFEHYGLICNKYTHTYTDSYIDKTISVKHVDGASPIQFFTSDAIKTVQRWYSEGYQPSEFLNAAIDFTQDMTFSGLGSQLETVPNIAPPKTNVLSGLFQHSSLFNQDISMWDVSDVTGLNYTFAYAAAFNQPIGSWDVSKVVDISNMFNGASSFDQDISGWNVSKVTNMTGMFFIAKVFNQPIGGWNTSKVEDMQMMFYGATSFNQDLSQWCVPLIASLPSYFAESATLFTVDKHPVWGTCPRGENSLTT